MKKKLLKLLTLLSIALSAGTSACQLLPNGNDAQPLACTTEVTVISAMCGQGAFQNNWLQLENGELLQPFENRTYVTSLSCGQKFRIGYEFMKRDNRYDNEIHCMALPPDAKPIRLLCIDPIVENGKQEH